MADQITGSILDAGCGTGENALNSPNWATRSQGSTIVRTDQRAEAGTLFAEAARMQQEKQPEFGLLYSLQGFRYCDWLLAPAEQAEWRRYFKSEISNLESQIALPTSNAAGATH